MTVGAANVGKNIVMILDNFPSHKAKIARQYAEDFGINLVYLPPYSPDLNPTEFIWKSIKREVSCEFILFEYPAARCGDGHENQLNLRCITTCEWLS